MMIFFNKNKFSTVNSIVFVAIFLFLGLIVNSAFAKNYESIFENANKLYQEKNYNEAIKLYDSIESSNYESAELYFMIPNNFDTDNYILLAYTKTQKYFCNNLSSGKIISIINPNYVRFDSDSSVNYSQPNKTNNDIVYNDIVLNTDNNIYKTRDKVNLKISFSEINKPEKLKYVLSVVRKGTIKNYQNKIRIKKDFEAEKNPKFLEEKRISLTGIIIDKATGNPIEGKEIYLSGLKTEKQIHVVNSDSEGQFYFSLYNAN